MKQTLSTNTETADRRWYVIDVAGMPLGRAAAAIATVVLGKHKPDFVNHADNGDFVVVLNAAQVKVTGHKGTDKLYRRHSRYPGHMTERSFDEMMTRDPRLVVELAVRRMLPKNKLGDKLIKKVKVYRDDKHRNVAQQPEPFPEHVLVGPRMLREVRSR
ncbi:MAG TPA: 50S ribosomal protein L13 [bacterium]|nr:50S ribosomal protein L13 [bacterium]